MYLIKVKENEYTIPKENIVMLALLKAMDLKVNGIPIKNQEQAIAFLESIGMEVSEVKEWEGSLKTDVLSLLSHRKPN